MLAIVLNRRDIREYDQMITLYTQEEGRREVLARGIKKGKSKNAAALMPFFLVEVEIVPGKDILHLTKAQIIESFGGITEDFTKMKLLMLSLESLNAMIAGEEHDAKIFSGLVEWLRFLNTEAQVRPAILDAFLLKMFAYLGLKIELDRCVSCGKSAHPPAGGGSALGRKDFFALDIKNGGVMCADCLHKREQTDNTILKVSVREINLLKLLLVKKIGELHELLGATKLDQVHTIVYMFVLFHGHRPVSDWAKAFQKG